MSLSSDQLEAKAERTRQRLSERLGRLESRVSPATVASDLFGLPPARTTDNLWPILIEQIRRNPVPVLLIAAGVTWLALFKPDQGRKGPSRLRQAKRRKNYRKAAATARG
jgi:hypothetical protein